MEFNFYEIYKDYSNTELLNIVKQPTLFQPSAVVAATKILSQRQISPEEVENFDQNFKNIQNLNKAKREDADLFRKKIVSFLEPLLHPAQKFEVSKWINILLFAIAIQFSWTLFITIKGLVNFFNCYYCRFDVTYYAEILTLLYIPVIFYLLLKKRRWGWIFLFADVLGSIIMGVGDSYFVFKYQIFYHINATTFVLPIVIKIGFIFFLWKDEIANYFGVSKETKKKTAIIIAGAAVFLILFMNSIT